MLRERWPRLCRSLHGPQDARVGRPLAALTAGYERALAVTDLGCFEEVEEAVESEVTGAAPA